MGAFQGAGRMGFRCPVLNWSLDFHFYSLYIANMGRAPHTKVILAMTLIRDGWTPYAAAKSVGISLSTIYRSVLYKEWKDAKDNPDPGTDGGGDSAR